MAELSATRKCMIPCSGSRKDCGFKEVVDRLVEVPNPSEDQVAMASHFAAWCAQAAIGLEAATALEYAAGEEPQRSDENID